MIKETEMDLVQRDLDGDLTLAEKETLQLLLAKNPELQLMHDRLQKVSRQLADLPPVTPAFSLVDAILPKLGSDSLKPVPAMPQLEREELPTLEWKPQEESVAKKSLIPIWFTKVGSGLAAACLLFGLFFLVKGAIDDKSAPGSQPGGTVVVNPVSTEPDPPAPKVEPAIQQPAPPTVAPPKPEPKPNAQVKNPQPPPKKPTVAKPTAPAQKPSKPAAAAQPAKPTDRGPIFPGAGSSMPGATPSDIEVAPVKKADQGKSDGTKEPQSGDDEKDKEKKNDDKKEEKQEDKQDDKNNGKNDDDDDKNDDDNEDENDDD